MFRKRRIEEIRRKEKIESENRYVIYKSKNDSVWRCWKTVGHKVGGVCPFGIKNGVEVYLDDSLKRFPVIYPACESSNSTIKLTIEELEKTSNYQKWIDIWKEYW